MSVPEIDPSDPAQVFKSEMEGYKHGLWIGITDTEAVIHYFEQELGSTTAAGCRQAAEAFLRAADILEGKP